MKTIALSLLAIVLLLQYRLWVSDGGMREVWRLRREVAAQTEQNAALNERNRTLAAEVQDLKKGKSAIEERARTDLGMVGSNESFFQVAPKANLTPLEEQPGGGEVAAEQTRLTSNTPGSAAASPSTVAADRRPDSNPLTVTQAGAR